MDPSKDYRKILGIGEDASIADTTNAFKTLVKLYHPDRVSEEEKDDANLKTRDLIEAYVVLKDPVRRYEYDRLRKRDASLDDILDRDGVQPHDFPDQYRGDHVHDRDFYNPTFEEMVEEAKRDGWEDADIYRAAFFDYGSLHENFGRSTTGISAKFISLGIGVPTLTSYVVGSNFGLDYLPFHFMMGENLAQDFSEPSQMAGVLGGFFTLVGSLTVYAFGLGGYTLLKNNTNEKSSANNNVKRLSKD